MVTAFVAAAASGFGPAPAAAHWTLAKALLVTQWANDVSPDKALPEYPRPQMARKGWTNLNGLRGYAITGLDASVPEIWEEKILVPFAIESALIGVGTMWYRRTIAKAQGDGERLLLHCGTTGWQAPDFDDSQSKTGDRDLAPRSRATLPCEGSGTRLIFGCAASLRSISRPTPKSYYYRSTTVKTRK